MDEMIKTSSIQYIVEKENLGQIAIAGANGAGAGGDRHSKPTLPACGETSTVVAHDRIPFRHRGAGLNEVE